LTALRGARNVRVVKANERTVTVTTSLSLPALAAEFETLARHVALCVTSAGRGHAECVAYGLERDLSVTLEPGSLMPRAEAILAEWRS
jgi:hypothetical protein